MPGKAETDKKLNRDLKTLAIFIEIYCRHRHDGRARGPVEMKGHDVACIAGKQINLCPDCTKLLMHAFVKRSRCPMDPKPACKHCPSHCYHPTYREQIREVMKFSGKKMVLSGRVDYLYRLLF